MDIELLVAMIDRGRAVDEAAVAELYNTRSSIYKNILFNAVTAPMDEHRSRQDQVRSAGHAAAQQVAAAYQRPAANAHGESKAPAPKPIDPNFNRSKGAPDTCNNFNTNKKCSKSPCPYKHTCSHCKPLHNAHPLATCTKKVTK